MTVVMGRAGEQRSSTENGRSAIRLDVEGLRAFAVLVVLVYHLDHEWLPGGFVGVDIFFVISGFLITSHLVKEFARNGTIALGSFYSRRIMRLIPASTLVLVATGIGTVVFVPRILWQQFGIDLLAAGGYSLNWVLAARSVDYLAEDSAASPVQHYWSLAVEEQFYILWPLLVLIAAMFAVRIRRASTAVVLIAAVLVFSASFALALRAAAIGDVSSYFTTTTRLWELAIGAIVAVSLTTIRSSVPARAFPFLSNLGLLALVGSASLIDGSVWPSGWTLMPAVGVALILIFSDRGSASVASRILSWRPLVFIGGISYAIYLWHWPLIVFASYVTHDKPLLVSALVLVGSILLSVLSAKFVERPLRFSRHFANKPVRGFALGGISLALTGALGLGIIMSAPANVLEAPPGASPAGARDLPTEVDLAQVSESISQARVSWVLPSPLDAVEDVPRVYEDGCQQSTTSSDVVSCSYGGTNDVPVLALVGDSKAAQWEPALSAIAESRGFKLVTFLKSSCAYTTATIDLNGSTYPSCAEWARNVERELLRLKPTAVLTSQVRAGVHMPSDSKSSEEGGRAGMVDSLKSMWTTLSEKGVRVLVLGDTPQTGGNVYECVAENPDDLNACSYDKEEGVEASALPTQMSAVRGLGGQVIDAGSPATWTTASESDRPSVIDFTSVICPAATECPPVVGNVMIYRSGSHITATYVETLGERLDAILLATGLWEQTPTD